MMTYVGYICDKNRQTEQLLASQKQFLFSGPTVSFNGSSLRTVFGLEEFPWLSHRKKSKKIFFSIYISQI